MHLHNGSITASIPVILKASTTRDGRRLIEVEASNESADTKKDAILR